MTRRHGASTVRSVPLPVRIRAPTRVRGENVVFADLLMIVPAALAGVGGVLLGDRAGLWLRTALDTRKGS